MSTKITLVQPNPIVGFIEANCKRIMDILRTSKDEILIFPLYSTTGFPPKDLLKYSTFWKELNENIHLIVRESSQVNSLIVLGTPFIYQGSYQTGALVINKGHVIGYCGKAKLDKLPVFDESEYFEKGEPTFTIEFMGKKLFITVDINAATQAPEQSLIINPAIGIYHKKIGLKKLEELRKIAVNRSSTVIQVNLAGSQDGLVFNGQSLVVKKDGSYEKAPQFEESVLTVDIDKQFSNPSFACFEEEVFDALKTGVKNYAIKNGFSQAALGLSGGIDSSLVAVIATEALGAENVVGVLMPSQFTSKESIEDALMLSQNLGIKSLTIPIKPMFDTFIENFKDIVKDDKLTVAEENLQSRIRGTILMTLSNRFRWLILATGNKSEAAVGYCTLYGDTAGALEVIGDLYKTEVYKLARWYNEKRKKVIPERVFTKLPTAELRPGQYDQEKLPPYELLDSVLDLYIEEGKSRDEIIQFGYDAAVVDKTYEMLRTSEYKRKQLPPVIKLSKVTLGYELNLPMTNFFKKL